MLARNRRTSAPPMTDNVGQRAPAHRSPRQDPCFGPLIRPPSPRFTCRRFRLISGLERTRVMFPAAELFGQNARFPRTEPCRSPTPTSPAPAWSAMAPPSRPTAARSRTRSPSCECSGRFPQQTPLEIDGEILRFAALQLGADAKTIHAYARRRAEGLGASAAHRRVPASARFRCRRRRTAGAVPRGRGVAARANRLAAGAGTRLAPRRARSRTERFGCASCIRRGATRSTRPSTCTAKLLDRNRKLVAARLDDMLKAQRQAVDRIVHRYRRLGAVLLDPDVGDDELRVRLLSTVPEAQLREDQSDLANRRPSGFRVSRGDPTRRSGGQDVRAGGARLAGEAVAEARHVLSSQRRARADRALAATYEAGNPPALLHTGPRMLCSPVRIVGYVSFGGWNGYRLKPGGKGIRARAGGRSRA